MILSEQANMNPKSNGFTLIEIVVVLVLISIIAATVFSRSITTDRINFVGQVDKIRNHIRYAQSLAMKSLDMNSDKRWGIKCASNRYWLFSYETIGDQNTPVILPGQKADRVNLSDLGVTMNAFTLFFDGLGKPYIASFDSELGSFLDIAITAGSESRTLRVSPKTGMIKTL